MRIGRKHERTKNFDFFQIELLACDLDESECFSDDELYDKILNFIMINSFPSILDKDRQHIVDYEKDLTHYYYIDPLRS